MNKLFITVIFLSLLSGQTSTAFNYQEPDAKVVLKKVTDNYNKNLDPKYFFKSSVYASKTFLKDFEAHVKKVNVEKFWKAELIGETLYLKKDDKIVTLQLVNIINTAKLVLKINGKTVSMDMNDGFHKNLTLMRSAINFKSSYHLWDLIIPSANAQEIDAPNRELEEALASATSSFTWLIDFIGVDQVKVEKDRFCSLNDSEKSKGYKTKLSEKELFKEIEYFAKIEDTYVKSEIAANNSGGECINCPARDLKDCLHALALTRNKEIEKKKFGLSCLVKYEADGAYYLNTKPTLVSFSESYNQQLLALDKAKARCETPTWDDEAACRARVDRKIASLKSNCPPDARTAELNTKRGYGSASGSAAGSK